MTNNKKLSVRAAAVLMTFFLISCDKKAEEVVDDLTSLGAFAIGQESVSAQSNLSAGLNNPGQMAVAGTKLIVADTDNNRVLIWNTIPTSAMTPADVVVGASTSPSILPPSDPENPAADTLKQPVGVATNGTNLIVIDKGHNRMLIWNSIPTVSGAPADLVFGQSDMNTYVPSSTARLKMDSPTAAYVSSGGKLFVTDTGNNRILVWNTIPTSNNAAPDNVIGQADFTTGSSGTSSTKLNRPGQVVIAGVKLLIADTNNCRVVVYNTVPTTDGAAANNVIGQADLNSNTCTTTSATRFKYPIGVAANGFEIYISESYSNRIVRFATVPTSDGETILSVTGQANVTSGSANRGGDVAANSMSYPGYLLAASGALYASDSSNHRLLKWASAPTADTAAGLQIGQINFNRNVAGQPIGGTTATSLLSPDSVHTDGTRFFIVDSGNNRVLIYTAVPSNNAATPIAIGQPDLTSGEPNNGGRSASTLSNPKDVFSDGTRLVVADYGNQRVLIWNSMPTTSGQAADVVLGASSMSALGSGYHDASGMTTPISVMIIGSKLLVGDAGFTRIMVWNSIPTTNDAPSNYVLGRPDADSMPTFDNTKEFYFSGMATDGTRLFVGDSNGYRVMVWNSVPSSNYAAADFVLGQPDLTTTSAPAGISLTEFGSVGRVNYSNGKLFVADPRSNRVLVWNSVSGTNQQAADHYFGQTTASGTDANAGGVSSTSLWSPGGVNYIGNLVFVADKNNNRVLVFPDSLMK